MSADAFWRGLAAGKLALNKQIHHLARSSTIPSATVNVNPSHRRRPMRSSRWLGMAINPIKNCLTATAKQLAVRRSCDVTPNLLGGCRQSTGDVVEHPGKLGADGGGGRDDHDRDKSGNQAIFNGGNAGLVTEKTSEKIFHGRGSIRKITFTSRRGRLPLRQSDHTGIATGLKQSRRFSEYFVEGKARDFTRFSQARL
jgi:hypothetical protein